MEDKSVDQVKFDISLIETDFIKKSQIELELQEQIAKLRAQLSEIQEDKKKLKNRRVTLDKELATAERKHALRIEQEEINTRLATLRREADDLIKDAPWRDKIFDWQLDGAIQLAGAQRGVLGDERGMGKTLSSLAWRRIVKSHKTLVLTRRAYAEDFIREVHVWEPHVPIIPIIGASQPARQVLVDILKRNDNFIAVANFEMWRRNIEDVIKDLLAIGFDGIILDEAHQLKTVRSVTTEGFMYLAYATPRLLEMTGTPVQNKPQELFAILHAAYPEMFPEPGLFVRDYCIQLDQNTWTWAPGGLDALMKKMAGFFIARSPEDVGHKVPPPAIHDYELTFDGYKEQEAAYKLVAEQSLIKMKSGKVHPIISILATMTRLAQITSWPAGIVLKDDDTGESWRFDVHQSVKLDAAEDLIKEILDEGKRVVLMSRFVEPVNELHRRFASDTAFLDSVGIEPTAGVAKITGETKNAAYKREVFYDFDLKTATKSPKYGALVATYDTVGEAINLNAARHLIQLDRYWKPAKDKQAIGRIDRINSTDQATVHRYAVKNTIDEYMISLINRKAKMLNDFKGAIDLQNGLIANLESML